MKDPLEDLLDAIPEVTGLEMRSRLIMIAARLNRQRALRKRVLDTLAEVMQDLRVSVAAIKHDLAATRRERDALKG